MSQVIFLFDYISFEQLVTVNGYREIEIFVTIYAIFNKGQRQNQVYDYEKIKNRG